MDHIMDYHKYWKKR